jgi:hypothetical protein
MCEADRNAQLVEQLSRLRASAERKNERLRELLRDIQWAGPEVVTPASHQRVGTCPCCSGNPTLGHTENCRVAAELRVRMEEAA